MKASGLEGAWRTVALSARRVLQPEVWIAAAVITLLAFLTGRVESDPLALERITGLDAWRQQNDLAARSFRVALLWISILWTARAARTLAVASPAAWTIPASPRLRGLWAALGVGLSGALVSALPALALQLELHPPTRRAVLSEGSELALRASGSGRANLTLQTQKLPRRGDLALVGRTSTRPLLAALGHRIPNDPDSEKTQALVSVEPVDTFEFGLSLELLSHAEAHIEVVGRNRPPGFAIEPASLAVTLPARGTGALGPWLAAGLLALGIAFALAALTQRMRPSIAATLMLAATLAGVATTPRSAVLFAGAAEGFEAQLPGPLFAAQVGVTCLACVLLLGASRSNAEEAR